MDLDNITQNLIVNVKLGNQKALNDLLERYESRVLRAVRLRLTQEQRFRLKLQSMDIVQEVNLTVEQCGCIRLEAKCGLMIRKKTEF